MDAVESPPHTSMRNALKSAAFILAAGPNTARSKSARCRFTNCSLRTTRQSKPETNKCAGTTVAVHRFVQRARHTCALARLIETAGFGREGKQQQQRPQATLLRAAKKPHPSVHHAKQVSESQPYLTQQLLQANCTQHRARFSEMQPEDEGLNKQAHRPRVQALPCWLSRLRKRICLNKKKEHERDCWDAICRARCNKSSSAR